MKFFIIFPLLIMGACSQQPVMQPPPLGFSLSGTWIFEKQDEKSVQYLLNRLNHVPMYLDERYLDERNSNKRGQRFGGRNMEQNLLRDLLVGLFTIVPNELYILQTDKQISIDFGVAGYHTFDLLTKTEIILDGFEVDSYAGWQSNEFVLQMNLGDSYQLLEKLTLINNKQQLLETIELKFSNNDNSLKHSRIYNFKAK